MRRTTVVLDTNILVSALMFPGHAPGKVVGMVSQKRLSPRCDERIFAEYRRVLYDGKFNFSRQVVFKLLRMLMKQGQCVVPRPLPSVPFAHEADRPFFEVAVHCGVPLVTGNARHYPEHPLVMDAATFLERAGY